MTPHNYSATPTLPGIDLSRDAMVADAIELLRRCQPKDKDGNAVPYHGCFSGGKDSCVIKELAKMAGVKVAWHYNVTTIDPPELVRFIRTYHPDVTWIRPKRGMFASIIAKGFPTRQNRWCCERYKERTSPTGARLLLGVRAEESPRRAKNWREVTFHTKTHEYAICPIVRWTQKQVWEFIRARHLPYCCLYDEGFDRIGCIGCPMGGSRGIFRDFQRWPGFKRCYLRAFRLLWARRKDSLDKSGRLWYGQRYFDSPDAMFTWWCSNQPTPGEEHKCQGLVELFS